MENLKINCEVELTENMVFMRNQIHGQLLGGVAKYQKRIRTRTKSMANNLLNGSMSTIISLIL